MGEQHFKAHNLRAYARLLVTLGEATEAERVAQESLQLSQSFHDRIFAGFAAITLGGLDLAAGRCDPARQRFAAGLAIAHETGNFQMLQEALLGLGAVELALGQADAAQRCYVESAAALTRLGIERSFYWAAIYVGLGQAALAFGEQAQAEAHFQAALAIPGCSAWDAERAAAGLAQFCAG
jgi:tetratricopeptide (TPR) repeat protein